MIRITGIIWVIVLNIRGTPASQDCKGTYVARMEECSCDPDVLKTLHKILAIIPIMRNEKSER